MVNWTGEKDAILLKGIFEKCDIKATQELCQELADRVGEGCTPKAISVRLYSFKTQGKGNSSKNGGSTKTTPIKPVASKTPASNGKGRAKKKKVDEEPEPADDVEEEKMSPSTNRKRKVKDEEDESNSKKVKTEQDEFGDIIDFDGAQGDIENGEVEEV